MSTQDPEPLSAASSPSLDALSSINDSARSLMALLGLNPDQPPDPQPQSSTNAQLPRLILNDHKRARDKFKRFELSKQELLAVLKVYRDRLAVVRQAIREEYSNLCRTLPSSANSVVVTTLGAYWVRTRNALLEQAIELTAEALRMARPDKVRRFQCLFYIFLIFKSVIASGLAQNSFQQR